MFYDIKFCFSIVCALSTLRCARGIDLASSNDHGYASVVLEKIECKSLNESSAKIECLPLRGEGNERTAGFKISTNYDIQTIDINLKVSILEKEPDTWKLKGQIKTSFCQMLEKNMYGIKQWTTGKSNFTTCPIKKGEYYVDSINTATSYHYPANLPDGLYKLNREVLADGLPIFIFETHSRVKKN